MYHLSINTAKGTLVNEQFVTDEVCPIGKSSENKVVLRGRRIDQTHAKLVQEEEGLFIYDLDSRSGVGVNGNKVKRYGPLAGDDVIEIHDYRLRVGERTPPAKADRPAATPGAEAVQAPGRTPASEEKSTNGVERPAPAAPPSPAPQSAAPEPTPPAEAPDGALAQSAELSEQAKAMHEWRVMLRRALHEQLDLRRVNVSSMSDPELREMAARLVNKVLDKADDLEDFVDRDELVQQVVSEAVGLGPLEPLLERDEISEIMVNSSSEVFYEQAGRIYKSDVTFTDDQAVQATIERIVAPIGRRIDESSPMVDARLKDGSRVNAVIPPLALKGSSITIRKFMKERLTAQHFVEFGSLNQAMVTFLEVAVRNRRNIVISGGTGSGKTTLLNVLSNFIPKEERIVTIEDSAELKLYQPNLVSMEGRPANQEGRGEVSIRDLVRNSLRMRPDRIVVGECRGGEALDMLQAMNTGHDGSLTTAHANSGRDCLSRLEVMVLMAGMDLPSSAIREQIASAIDLVVQQTRFACGSRKITSITEVVGVEQGRIQLAEVFRYRQTGYDANGRVEGAFEPTGLIPEFYENLRQRGIGLDLDIFDTGEEASA